MAAEPCDVCLDGLGPGIADHSPAIRKVLYVAGCDGGAVQACDRGDHGIRNLVVATARCDNGCEMWSCLFVERQNVG
nr:hypothetical protein [Enterovirga sp. DB1703]